MSAYKDKEERRSAAITTLQAYSDSVSDPMQAIKLAYESLRSEGFSRNEISQAWGANAGHLAWLDRHIEYGTMGMSQTLLDMLAVHTNKRYEFVTLCVPIENNDNWPLPEKPVYFVYPLPRRICKATGRQFLPYHPRQIYHKDATPTQRRNARRGRVKDTHDGNDA